MTHYFQGEYLVRTHPILLPDHNRWRVQFTIARRNCLKTAKIFTFPDTFYNETKAIERCMKLAENIISGKGAKHNLNDL